MDLYQYNQINKWKCFFIFNNIIFSNVYYLNKYFNSAIQLTTLVLNKPYSMRHLNIEEPKLKIIEQIIILNDDSVFEKVENLINESLQRPESTKLTRQELIDRALLSNIDIENKDIYTSDQVEKLSNKWQL